MDYYNLPEKSLTLKAIPKASSAVGLYFVCPACNYEMIYSDQRMARERGGCPNCHASLVFPDGKELERIHQLQAEIYTP